jgi:hypothetical protein
MAAPQKAKLAAIQRPVSKNPHPAADSRQTNPIRTHFIVCLRWFKGSDCLKRLTSHNRREASGFFGGGFFCSKRKGNGGQLRARGCKQNKTKWKQMSQLNNFNQQISIRITICRRAKEIIHRTRRILLGLNRAMTTVKAWEYVSTSYAIRDIYLKEIDGKFGEISRAELFSCNSRTEHSKWPLL